MVASASVDCSDRLPPLGTLRTETPRFVVEQEDRNGSSLTSRDRGPATEQLLKAPLPNQSLSARTAPLEARFKDKFLRPIEAVQGRDLQCDSDLREEILALRLSDHFDFQGLPRFRRLGMSVVVKEQSHLPAMQVAPTQGHVRHGHVRHGHVGHVGEAAGHEDETSKEPQAGPKQIGFRAFRLSSRTLERDMHRWRQNCEEATSQLQASDIFATKDVQGRQLEVFFQQVPDFERFLPEGKSPAEFNLPELDLVDDHNEKRLQNIANRYFEDDRWFAGHLMNWSMTKYEARGFSQILTMWILAARSKQCDFAMDRPTFCQLILDLGLVDQKRVPFFWAVSLFDSLAKPMFVTEEGERLTSSCQIAQMVNRWQLLSVLDVILRRHFDSASIRTFIASLFEIAQLRLPAWVITQSGLTQERYEELIRRGEISGVPAPELKSKATQKQKPQEHDAKKELYPQESRRERRICSMLLEPEVLHVLWQYSAVFSHLWASYSNSSGHLTYSAVVQLCEDLQICPKLISAHCLKQLYESSRCLELLTPPGRTSILVPPKTSMHLAVHKVMDVKRVAKIIGSLTKASLDAVSQAPAEEGNAALDTISVCSSNERLVMKKSSSKRHRDTVKAQPDSPRLQVPGQGWQQRSSFSRETSEDAPTSPTLPTSSRKLRHIDTSQGALDAKQDSETPKGRRPTQAGSGAGVAHGRRMSVRPGQVTRQDSTETPKERKPSGPGALPNKKPLQNQRRSSTVLSASSVASPEKGKKNEKNEKTEPEVPVAKNWPLEFPWHGVMQILQASKQIPPRRRPYKFGESSLVELLCRAAFTHLEAYGNTQQKSMTGYQRVLWLLIYLRSVLHHLQKSLGNHDMKDFPGLEATLRNLRPEMWSEPPKATASNRTEVRLFPVIVRPGLQQPPEELRLPAVPPIREKGQTLLQMSSPFVVDQVCRQCQQEVLPSGGNPKCLGCSWVDAVPFKCHPLAGLLIDRSPDVRLEAVSVEHVLRAPRSELTPPPLCVGDSFHRNDSPRSRRSDLMTTEGRRE